VNTVTTDLKYRDELMALALGVAKGRRALVGNRVRRAIRTWTFAQQLAAFDGVQRLVRESEALWPEYMEDAAAGDIVRASAKRTTTRQCILGLAEYTAGESANVQDVAHSILGSERNWIDGLYDTPLLLNLNKAAYSALCKIDHPRQWRTYVPEQLRLPHYGLDEAQHELVRTLCDGWCGTGYTLLETVLAMTKN
jgi:hypothetical protein